MNGHVSTLSSNVRRSGIARLGAGFSLIALAALAGVSATSQQSSAQSAKALKSERQIPPLQEPIEIATDIQQPTLLHADITPLGALQTPGAARGGAACPPPVVTYSSADFGGGTFVLQAGFVEGEMAGISIVADPAEFPIIVRTTEMILAQQNATVTTTTHWSILVWEGTPDTGNLVATFSSDDVILPHAVMPPGTNGLNIQVTVDPTDPDQIVVQNNGSDTFSVAYRIDQHNNPPTAPCNFGLTQAACCPPPTNSNAFPTTDTPVPNNPNFPTQNWLYCLPGCTPAGFVCPGGWHRFSNLGAFRPSGDWNIRVTYEPFDCPDEPFGACCFSNGTCTDDFLINCNNQGGSFQGDGTDCNVEGCPDPVGACCFFPQDPPGPAGATCALETEAECATRNDPGSGMFSVWSGPGVQCVGTSCPDSLGACCFSDNNCVTLSFGNCGVAGGNFQGIDTDCNTFVCNPFGACCMPDGSCTDEFETDCATLGGTFQGHEVFCEPGLCPQPVGACCLANGNCINEIEANCIAIPGATWQGMGTDCGDADMNGTADDCEKNPAVGACCLESGSCIIDSQPNCEGIPNATYAGHGTTCDDCTTCPADIADSNGPGQDGLVNVFDLLELLSNWNTNGNGADIAAPFDNVDVFDLLDLLGFWSPTPCP